MLQSNLGGFNSNYKNKLNSDDNENLNDNQEYSGAEKQERVKLDIDS